MTMSATPLILWSCNCMSKETLWCATLNCLYDKVSNTESCCDSELLLVESFLWLVIEGVVVTTPLIMLGGDICPVVNNLGKVSNYDGYLFRVNGWLECTQQGKLMRHTFQILDELRKKKGRKLI